MLKNATVILILVLSAVETRAQLSATQTADAAAGVTTGIGITNTADLSFGDMLSPTAAGTVNVGLTSNRTSSASITTVGGIVSSAEFNIAMAGGGAPHFWIQLPTTVTIQSGANSMTVNGFTSNAGPADGYGAHCVSGGGNPQGTCPKTPFTLAVGATLNVTANQPAGTYTGTFTVTVNKY